MKKLFSGKGKFFFRRRNLIVMGAILLLAAAVFVNYKWFYDPVSDMGFDQAAAATPSDSTAASAQSQTEADYFSAADLARRQARDEALEVLQTAVSNSGSEEDALSALARINRIAEDIEDEANIETLLLAKGFSQCVAVINGDTASVIVGAEGESLLPSQVAQISTVVYEQTGILPSNVTIIQK